MNKRGEIELKDFSALFVIYIILMTTVASSTNISISENSSLPLPEQPEQEQPETTQENLTEETNQSINTTFQEPEIQNQTNQTFELNLTNIAAPTINTSTNPTQNNSIKIELIQFPAKVGEKVKWAKRAYTNDTSYKIEIPSNAEEIPKRESFSITETKDYIEIEYETPAPQKTETKLPNGKQVLVYSEEHYSNVTATTQIDFNLNLEEKDSLKIYWKEESRYLDFQAFDTNNDNLIDYIGWQISHLSNQTFEIILITDAIHLDENKTFIENIYNEVKELDNIWSPTIQAGEYIRITFEKELDNTKDITLYPRIISGKPKIEVYEKDGTELITEFTNITEGENKVYLNNLIGLQDTFDLKILEGSMEFDYIVDPTDISIFYEDFETATFDNWTNTAWTLDTTQAINTYSAECAQPATCTMNSNYNLDTSLASSVNVTFMYRDDDCDAGDAILYFNDSAGNWDSMGNINAGSLGQAEDTWNSHAVTTSDSQYLHPGFAVRFWANPDDGNGPAKEFYWIDNIQITSRIPSPPNVTLTYPAPNFIYGNSAPLTFNATITADSNLANCSLWANHTGTWHLNQTNLVTGTSNTTSFNLALPTDNYFVWNVKCTDVFGKIDWADSNRSVLPDRTYPLIDFAGSTEEDGTIFSRNWIYAQVSLVETNFKNITFSLYNSTGLVNQTTSLTQKLNITWITLPNEVYHYNVTIFDITNNSNSTETRQIQLDTIAPTGSNTSPSSGTITNDGAQNLTATFSDGIELKDATLYVLNSTGQVIYTTLISLTGLTETVIGVVFDFLYDDVFTWFYQIQDSADNDYNTTSSTLEIDTIDPVVTFISPTEETSTVFLRNYITLNTSIYERNYKNVTFFLYNSTSLVNYQPFSDSTRSYNFTSLPDGTYFYNVSSYDLADNEGHSETRDIILDTTAPILYFSGTTELNDSVITGSQITAEVTATEANEQNITFRLYNSTGGLAKPSATFTDGHRSVTWTLLGEGVYFYNVTMFDQVSLSNSTETRKITLDNTAPIINFAAPTENNTANKSQTWIFVNTTITETNFANTTFFLYNSTGEVGKTTFTNSTRSYNFTSLPNGIYFYNVTTLDRASQKASTTTRKITLDTVAPIVTFVPPTEGNGTIVNRNWLYVNGSVIEDYPRQAIVSTYINGELYESHDATGSEGIGHNLTGLESNIYEYNVTVTDWSGNKGYSETRWIGLDYEGPIIDITDPIESKTYSANESLPLNFSAYDEIVGIDTCWYNLDEGPNQTIDCATNTTFDTTVAPHTLYFFANDTFGTTTSSSVSFSISITGPAIELTAPENDTFYDTATLVNFSFTAADPDAVDTCSLYGNWGGAWHLNDSYVVLQEEENSSVFSAEVSGEGSYVWNIKCNDTMGWDSFSLNNFTFSVDVTDPQVFFGTGTEDSDTNFGRNWIYADANLIENNFKNITFNLYNASGIKNTNTFTDETRQINWTGLTSGVYHYNITVYDKAGHIGYSETRQINLDLIAPAGELQAPANDSYTNTLSNNLTATFTDATGLLNATLYVLNATGYVIYTQIVEIGGLLEATIGVVYNFLQEGTYSWFYSIEDIVGNKFNTTENILMIYTTPPLIEYTIGTEDSGKVLDQSHIFVNVTAYDEHWANITFDLYDSDSHVFSNTFTDETRQINWTLLPNEIYYYNVTATDQASNINSTETRNITLDTIFPTIDFASSTQPTGAFISGDTIHVNVTVTEANEQNITFRLYNSTGHEIKSNTFSSQQRVVEWNLLSEGTYYYNVTVVDKVGHSASTTTRAITIDDTHPQITYGIETLSSNSYANQDWLFVKATITETNFQNVTFTLYNSTGQVSKITFTDTTREINFTNLIDTTYWYNITTSDKASNINTTLTRYATLDSIFPTIDFTSPTEINTFNTTRNWIFINTTASDINFQNITFSLYDSTSIINQTTLTGSTRAINFTNLPSKIYYYNVTTSDKASNSNTTETRQIGLDYLGPSIQITSPQPKAYGYNESLPLTYTVTDAIVGADTCWYNLDNGANTTIDCASSTTFNTTDGEHTLHFFANDTLSNLGYKNVTFLISTTGPAILLVAPEDNTFYSQSTEVFFNYTAEDPDLTESCSLYGTWNGGWHLNQTDPNWILQEYFYTLKDFETATFDNWTNTAWTLDTTQAINTYSAECAQPATCTINSNYNLDTSLASSVNVTFMYRDDDCDAGDAILYFNDSTGNWDSMGNINAGSLGQAEDTWNSHTVTTSDSQYLHPGFAVRFWANPDDGSGPAKEYYWIDNVQINYTVPYNKPSGNFTLGLSEEGSSDWNIFCNDTQGYITSAVANRTITFDVTNPVVDFGANTLPDNSNVSQNYIYINTSIIENNFQNMTFSLYNTTSLVSTHFQNNTERDHTFTNLYDATYFYNVTVYDSASRSGSSPTRRILLDTTNPIGNLQTPSDNSYSNNATQNLTATFSDANGLEELILYIYNSTGLVYSQIIPLAGQLVITMGTMYEFLIDGVYDWFYQVEDTTGNKYNTTNYTIIIDTTAPQINFIPSTLPSDTYIKQTYIYFNTSVTETNFKNITFYLHNGEGLYTSHTYTTPDTTRDINFTLLPDDQYFYNVTSTDKAGNVNKSETRTITLDNLAPTASYDSSTEANAANKSQNYIFINTSITETNFANITFYLYSTTGLLNQTTYTSLTKQINFTSLGDGVYYYNATIKDKASQTFSLPTRKITLDTTAPILSFIAPTEDSGKKVEKEYIYLNTSITETNLKNITFYLYNTTGLLNQTTYTSLTKQINFTASSENKTYFYNATIFDTAGNYNSTLTRNITLIDTTYPTLTLNSPENRTYYSNISIQIGYYASDLHLDTCWYNLDSGANITMPGCYSTVINVADEQSHVVKVYANDTLGYTTSQNVTFTVNSSAIGIPESYSVKRGSVFTDGNSTVSISRTNPTKGFILHTVRGADSNPATLQVTPYFTDPEKIIFKNYESGSGVIVEWSLISGPNITNQRGEIAYTSETTIPLPITQVNLSNSFIIVSNRLNSTTQSENIDGFWTAEFVDDSTVNFTRSSASASGVLFYQIVSWEGASVQKGSAQISNTATITTETISQADPNKTLVIFSKRADSTMVQDSILRGAIKNSTALEFIRTGSAGSLDIEWFTIESELFESQHGTYTHTISSIPQYTNIPTPLINTSRSFDVHSNSNAGATTSFATAALTQNIYNKTAIVLQKGVASGAGTTSWSAIEITESDNPIVALEYPSANQNISSYTISQFNFSVTDESGMLNCSLYGNWSGGWHLNQTIQAPANSVVVNFSSVTVEPDAYYMWNVKCVDVYGNNAFSSSNSTFAAFLPPTNPTIYNISQTSNDGTGEVSLSWNHSNHSLRYDIYVGPTISSMAYITQTSDTNYTDISFAGKKRMFYKIVATNPVGENSSDIFGAHLYELKHNIIKSQNWIAFPSNFSDLSNANETLSEITQATSFTIFNSTTQSRVTCNEFSCPESLGCTATNCNFEIEAGKGYELNINTSLSQEVNWSSVGKVYPAQTVDLTKNATSFGKNWISIYANTTLSNAQGLIASIPNADAVSRWNPDTQTSQGLIPSPFPWIPGFIGTNFQLNLEEGYEASVTSSTQWTQE